MTIRWEPPRTVVINLGLGDVVACPLVRDGRVSGALFFPIEDAMGVGWKYDISDPRSAEKLVDVQEMAVPAHPRVEIVVDSLEACRGALVLADALRSAAEHVAEEITDELREHGRERTPPEE